jgi:hypothetical protein
MLKKTMILFLIASALFFTLTSVLAAPNINELTGNVAAQAGYDSADAGETALSERVGGIIRIAMTFVGTLFLALTVYAGFLWMTASGNEEQVTKATGILKMAVIGLVIVVAAYGITTFVVGYTVGSAQGSAPVGATGATTAPDAGFWSGFSDGWSKGWQEFKNGF